MSDRQSFEWVRSDIPWSAELWERIGNAYHQVTGNDLKDFSFETGSSRKNPLEHADEGMAHRRTDEGTINSHLGYPRAEVMAIFATVMGEPGCQKFL